MYPINSYATATYTLEAEYIHGIGIDNVLRVDYHDGETTEDYYYHKDGMGSTTEITDNDGVIIQAYEYDACGNATIYDPSSEIPNSFLYNGREWDSEINLYYYRPRHYAPQLGRFLQPDTMGYSDGNNMYTYALNSPQFFTDWNGHTSLRIDFRHWCKKCDRWERNDEICPSATLLLQNSFSPSSSFPSAFPFASYPEKKNHKPQSSQ